VEIHIGSGKVSLMRYDDFEGKTLPRMAERVKIKLREQDIDKFAFEEALEGLGLFDFSGYGPKPGELLATLAANRWAVDGFELVRSTSIPDLDDPCGRYLTFRQLIECGESQARTRLPNPPRAAGELECAA
jgi:hypothetical protein